jgi:SAM-dependent methyltransferase
MPIKTIVFKDKQYPEFQAQGFAAQFAFPFAHKICEGNGVDIGCNRFEWKFPNAIPVDPAINPEFHAMNIPDNHLDPHGQWDYIFSSHCLEHLDDWTSALLYWKTRLKPGGVLFLYLPHYSQEYWRTWNNRKHKHNLMPEQIHDFFKSTGWVKCFVSGADLNNSFYAIAENS